MKALFAAAPFLVLAGVAFATGIFIPRAKRRLWLVGGASVLTAVIVFVIEMTRR